MTREGEGMMEVACVHNGRFTVLPGLFVGFGLMWPFGVVLFLV